MKTSFALAAALAVAYAPAHAQITVSDSSYAVTPYFTHSNADSIVSYDVGSDGGLYYQTQQADFTFGGFYRAGVATALTPGFHDPSPAAVTVYAGASVVSIGQSIYYNTSNAQGSTLIYQYGLLGATPTVRQASTENNYGLFANAGRLFVTGAPAPDYVNHIYYNAVNPADGSLSAALDLGQDIGASGPLAFDAQGDLYYAPGNQLSIYRWSKSDVDAALADPATHPLGAAGHQWLDYSGDADFSSLAGGTSLLVDGNGNLLLTVTNFSTTSALARFGVANNGAYDGNTDTVLKDNGLLGELRLEGNALLLSSGNQILQIVPEPSAVALLLVGALGGGMAMRFRRRQSA